MDLFLKNRVIFILIGVLLITNMASLATLWILHFTDDDEKDLHTFVFEKTGKEPEAIKEFIEKKLRFSPVQISEFETGSNAHFERTNRLRDSIYVMRAQLNDQVMQARPDDQKVQRIVSQIGNLYAEIERLNYHHFREIWTNTDKDKRPAFEAFLNQVEHRLSPGVPVKSRIKISRHTDGGREMNIMVEEDIRDTIIWKERK